MMIGANQNPENADRLNLVILSFSFNCIPTTVIFLGQKQRQGQPALAYGAILTQSTIWATKWQIWKLEINMLIIYSTIFLATVLLLWLIVASSWKSIIANDWMMGWFLFLHARVESNHNQINHIGMVCRFGQKLSHVCQKWTDDSQTSVTFWLTYSGTMSAPKLFLADAQARTKKVNIDEDTDCESAPKLFSANGLCRVPVKAHLFLHGSKRAALSCQWRTTSQSGSQHKCITWVSHGLSQYVFTSWLRQEEIESVNIYL
jgi:hypothetical protein